MRLCIELAGARQVVKKLFCLQTFLSFETYDRMRKNPCLLSSSAEQPSSLGSMRIFKPLCFVPLKSHDLFLRHVVSSGIVERS